MLLRNCSAVSAVCVYVTCACISVCVCELSMFSRPYILPYLTSVLPLCSTKAQPSCTYFRAHTCVSIMGKKAQRAS